MASADPAALSLQKMDSPLEASAAGLKLEELLQATRPGWYRVVRNVMPVSEEVGPDSDQVAELPQGAAVEVAEVVRRQQFLRGRLEQPRGWVSLVSLADDQLLAELCTSPLAAIASVESNVGSLISREVGNEPTRDGPRPQASMRWRALTEGAEPSGQGQPVRALRRDDPSYWRSNFIIMAILFSISEATVTTPISYATSLLDPKAGQLGTGGVFLFVVISALLIGPLTAKSMGAKKGLMFGMLLDTLYAALFALAVDCEMGSLNQWVLYTVGCLCSGIGSGIIWTCQGKFFAESVAQIIRCEFLDTQERTQATSRVARETLPNQSSSCEAPSHPRSSRRSSMQSRILASPSMRRALSTASLGHASFSGLWAESLAGSLYGSMLPRYEEFGSSLTDPLVMEEREQITAELGGTFAALYLGTDVAMKMSASILQGSFLQWTLFEPLLPVFPMFVLYAVASLLTVFIMAAVLREPESITKTQTQEPVMMKVTAALKLWPRPELWCLGMTNFAFGFTAGYINGYVNGAYTAKSSVFGTASIGTLMALTSLVAAAFALIFGLLSKSTGKGPIVAVGAAAFALIPVLTLMFKPNASNGYWGTSLIWLYVIQGLGRSVYESTNKAVFADFFPGQDSAGAFANCQMQNGLAFFCSFLLQSFLTSSANEGVPDMDAVAWVVLVLAVLTVPGYIIATILRSKRRREHRSQRQP